MSDRLFLDILAEQVRRILRPLVRSLKDEESFAALLARYGWTVDPQTFSIANVRTTFAIADDLVVITQMVAAIDAEGDTTSIERYLELLDRLRAVIDKLQTVAASAPPNGLPAELWSGFAGELFEGLLADYFERYQAGMFAFLLLTGIVEEEPVEALGTAGRTDYMRRRVRWQRLSLAVTDPVALARETVSWGDPNGPLKAGQLLSRLARLATVLGLPAATRAPSAELLAGYFDPLSPFAPQAREVSITLMDVTGSVGARLETRLFLLPIPPKSDRSSAPSGILLGVAVDSVGIVPTSTLWPFSVQLTGPLGTGAGLALELYPGEDWVLASDLGDDQIDAALLMECTIPGPSVLLGSALSHRLETDDWSLGLRLLGDSATPEMRAELRIEGARLLVDFGDADGFLQRVLGAGSVAVALDAALVWSSETGLAFEGSGAIELLVPIQRTIGPAELQSVSVGIRVEEGPLTVVAGVTGRVLLGPITAVFEKIGVELVMTPRPAGQPAGLFGGLDFMLGFKPPDGLGFAVEAGPIRGGGFINFDKPRGRYSGLLHLSLSEIGIDALGLLDTKLPGGVPPFALLVALRGSFPPIQVGFGFALSSVGGLLALNRCINVDELRARYSTGTVGRFLAPEDPVRDAPTLLADLAAVFPPADGIFVVGPTLQLSWVELVRFDLGVFVELPPLKIVLLGSARATIANPAGGAPMLQLRVDVMGLLDFARKLLEFDAVLIDSQLLEVFELTGGGAFRLSWGAEPYVVMSVGGFHPAWSPAPLVFPPSLTRIAAVRGSPEDMLYLRFEGYFAITTNTLQFGASIEVIVNVDPLDARGFLAFDTLIRFQPFYFQIDFNASVKIRWKRVTLAGVELSGTLCGPGPVTFHGRACFEILFFEHCWSDTFTFGSSAAPVITPIPSAVVELAKELEDAVNLTAQGGDDPYVVLGPDPSGSPLPVLRPGGELTWTQQRAPLDLLLMRFEGAPLAQPETVSATGPHVTGPAADWFAPGGYSELSEAEALNQKAFLRLNGGFRLGASGIADGRSEEREVDVNQIRLPVPSPAAFDFILPSWLLQAIVMRVGAEEPAAAVAAIAVRDEAWVVRSGNGGVSARDVSEAQAHRLATFGPGHGAAVAATDVVPAFPF
jgi:hypothetical protein